MAATVKQMLEAANAAVPKITPVQTKEMIAKGNAVVVDVRDPPEVAASGKVAGTVHVSRGMLEFRADPDLPPHDKNFAKDKTVILLLRLRRPRGACGQHAQGHRLRQRLQSRRLQGLGRQRRRGREGLGRAEPAITACAAAGSEKMFSTTWAPRHARQPVRIRRHWGKGRRKYVESHGGRGEIVTVGNKHFQGPAGRRHRRPYPLANVPISKCG
jgi:rhodanese-related sulfurtransferase